MAEDKPIEITTELIEKARAAKSADEIAAIADEQGVEMSGEETASIYASLHEAEGEIADDELDNVAGGGCGEPPPPAGRARAASSTTVQVRRFTTAIQTTANSPSITTAPSAGRTGRTPLPWIFLGPNRNLRRVPLRPVLLQQYAWAAWEADAALNVEHVKRPEHST